MTTPDRAPNRHRDRPPSVAEIAALTRRLRELSTAGRDADPAARAAFLADKQALLDRITHAHGDGDGDGGAARTCPVLTEPGVDVSDDELSDDTAAGWSR